MNNGHMGVSRRKGDIKRERKGQRKGDRKGKERGKKKEKGKGKGEGKGKGVHPLFPLLMAASIWMMRRLSSAWEYFAQATRDTIPVVMVW
jgi:hypothetical protein